MWDTGDAELKRGVDEAVALLAEVPSLESVGFATNSLRRLSGAIAGNAFFVTAARKPLLTRPYKHLPHPGVVVGDQLATDGCWPGGSASRSRTSATRRPAIPGARPRCASSAARCGPCCSAPRILTRCRTRTGADRLGVGSEGGSRGEGGVNG